MLNPLYDQQMNARQDAQAHNRAAKAFNLMARTTGSDQFMGSVVVPKQPNRYVPHYGAKGAAKYAGRGSLGLNASRALREDPATSKTVRDILSVADEGVAMIGQTVTWTSSNLKKTGEIVAVVPAGERPKNDFTPKVDVSGGHRDHISYVVRANGKHYWPRVSLLNLGGV